MKKKHFFPYQYLKIYGVFFRLDSVNFILLIAVHHILYVPGSKSE